MAKHLECDAADGTPRHAHENDVAQFGEHGVRSAQGAVEDKQRERQDDYRGLRVESVDHFPHDQWHANIGDLGCDQKQQRQDDAALKLP